MDVQIKKGILDLCVLKALEGGESYGYKIINDLKDVVEISESTLYPILRRLEAGGYLITHTAEHGGRLRRYYFITEQGKARLDLGRQDFLEIKSIYTKLFGGTL